MSTGDWQASHNAVIYLCNIRAEEALPVLRGALTRYHEIGLQRCVVKNISKSGSG